jgi:hypothetical protein
MRLRMSISRVRPFRDWRHCGSRDNAQFAEPTTTDQMPYFTTNSTDIRRMSEMLCASLIVIAALVLALKFIGLEALQSSPFAIVLGLAGIAAMIAYAVLVFLLTRSLDPNYSTAWLMVLLQVIPFLGIPAAISLIVKGFRVTKSGAHRSPAPEAKSTEAG